jgi:hypothetical protein
MSKGFLHRWSRRKSSNLIEVGVHPGPDSSSKNQAVEIKEPENSEVPLIPTMDDVEKIDKGAADFSAFMNGDVDPTVQRAAMRKLFSDPHFNVMDGLDIYIDDYSKPDPVSAEMLSKMVQSEMLGLFKNQEETAVGDKKENGRLDKHPSLETDAQHQKIAGEQIGLVAHENTLDQVDIPSKIEKKME